MTQSTEQASPTVGEIRIFSGTYAPVGWAFCRGQILSINDYPGLYSVIRNTYGTATLSSFVLPDLRGRIVIGSGQGEGLSNRPLGTTGGESQVTLTTNQIPSHNHNFIVSTAGGTETAPMNNLLAIPSNEYPPGYSGEKEDIVFYLPENVENTRMVSLDEETIADNSGGEPHNNMQPYLALNYIICTNGVLPPK